MFVRSVCGALLFSLMVPMLAVAQQAAPAPQPVAQQEPVTKEDMKLSSEKDVGYGAETSFLTWHGYIDLEFLKQQQGISTFDLHEFYLSAKAQVSEKVSVTAEFEYEHAPEKLVLPMQAYVDYAVNQAFVVRGGIFFVPIGLPRTYTLRGNKNRMVRQNALTHDLMFENWAEHGINVFGQFKSGLFYDVAVTNGMPNTMGTGDSWFDAVNTLQDHTEDNNNNKALLGRFGYQKKTGAGDFNVGVSYATQKYDPAEQREMIHRGVDLRYVHSSGLRFQGEYMRRSGDDNAVDLAKGIAADANGWVAQVSRRFPFNGRKSYVEPVFQVDAIDLNEHTDTNGDKLYTAIGAVFSPVQNYLVKFEYDWVKEVHGTKAKNNKLWLALVAEF
jgi:hypothetical protein